MVLIFELQEAYATQSNLGRYRPKYNKKKIVTKTTVTPGLVLRCTCKGNSAEDIV